MKIWLITDTHYNHDKMIELCGRPKNFARRIHRNLVKELGADDLLIHLGDVCIGNDADVHERYVATLPGRRVLVRGNHDRKSDHWYLTHGWHFVCEQFTMTASRKRILFSHAPVPDDGSYDVNVHGHLHNSGHRPAGDSSRRRLLAIEETDYQPVLLRTFLRG